MRARMATACEDLGRRDSIASFSLSSELTLSGLVGRPMAIAQYAPGHLYSTYFCFITLEYDHLNGG
jgi:hypothetical protein